MNKISLIVPCYNEAEVLPILVRAMNEVADGMCAAHELCFEYIFVDDGSADDTLGVLKDLRREFSQGEGRDFRYLSFSRNFGKEAAMFAGLEHSTGDFVAILDADMQHPPELLARMYEDITQGGCDCVATRRVNRLGEPKLRSFFARSFYKFINSISDTEIVDGACDFRMMTRQMANAVISLREKNRFSKGLFSWVGFRTRWIEFENRERAAGETSWSFWQLLAYSVEGIAAFSTRPLIIATVIGILLCVAAMALTVFYAVKTLVYGDPVSGFPTLICTVMFLGGIQLFCIGLIGQYLAKTYIEVKGRPIYILRESAGGEERR
ncbi:MAG: glycosyltransferase family 2 protein [Clostridiales Family XIII bacterium]|jgi:glycosyltransferase involved in cell wall biosynthesis|nr:glycosyltransferase family 2 protein [Clostridiales Family XIII bacterium]